MQSSLALIAGVRADHAHLCDVVIFVRPLQKRIRQSQSGKALKQGREAHQSAPVLRIHSFSSGSLESYLQTLDGGEECEGQGEEGPRAELPQLAPRDAAPVDGPGVAHLQHQVHGSFAASQENKEHVASRCCVRLVIL